MSFDKTDLPHHPIVKQAYGLLANTVGVTHPDIKAAILAAERFAAGSVHAKPEAVAALMFINHGFPHAQTLGDDVAAYAESVLGSVDEELVSGALPVRINDPVKADMVLVRLMAALEENLGAIQKNEFYLYDTMTGRLQRFQHVAESANKGSEALVDATQARLVSMRNALENRVRETRRKFIFENAGLPDHPLIRKAYAYTAEKNLTARPHDGGLLNGLLIEAKILLSEVDQPEPEQIAALLLHQNRVLETAEIEAEYGPRVAELCEHVMPRRGSGARASVSGGAEIRAVIYVHVLEGQVASYMAPEAKTHRDEEWLADIEHFRDNAQAVIDAGIAAPRLAQRLNAAVASATQLISAPESRAIREPGTPRPDPGY